jgi:hypothetical protein
MRPWMLLVGGIGLVAGHVILLYYGLPHAALSVSAAAVSGVIVLIVIKHLGLLGPLHTLFRRQR